MSNTSTWIELIFKDLLGLGLASKTRAITQDDPKQ